MTLVSWLKSSCMNCVSPVLWMVLVTAPFKAVTMVPITAHGYRWSCTFNSPGGSDPLAPTASAAQYLRRGLRAPSLPSADGWAPVVSELSGLNKLGCCPQGLDTLPGALGVTGAVLHGSELHHQPFTVSGVCSGDTHSSPLVYLNAFAVLYVVQ